MAKVVEVIINAQEEVERICALAVFARAVAHGIRARRLVEPDLRRNVSEIHCREWEVRYGVAPMCVPPSAAWQHREFRRHVLREGGVAEPRAAVGIERTNLELTHRLIDVVHSKSCQ